MRKKPRQPALSDFGNQNTSFSNLLNILDPEREAQRQEFLKRAKERLPKNSPKNPPKKPKKPRKPSHKPNKSKAMSFEEKLDQTNQWLKETFPGLFDPSQPKALDAYIVRDIKAHYKNEREKKKYPDGLVIKAALSRYMESPAYLNCLVKGAPRYNIKGEVSGFV